MGTQHPSQRKWAQPPQFSAHFYCGQTAGYIVLDGDSATSRERGTAAPAPSLAVHVYCGHGRASQLLVRFCILYWGNTHANVKAVWNEYVQNHRSK